MANLHWIRLIKKYIEVINQSLLLAQKMIKMMYYSNNIGTIISLTVGTNKLLFLFHYQDCNPGLLALLDHVHHVLASSEM